MALSFLQFLMRIYERQSLALAMTKLQALMATPPFSTSKSGLLWEGIYVWLFRISSIMADFLNR
jgi:hypothetical protein